MAEAKDTMAPDAVGIEVYFDSMPELGASDMHVKTGVPIMMRVGGALRPLDVSQFVLEGGLGA